MIAETLSVGTELLLGQIVDTNAASLSRTLSSLGISLYYRGTVGDNPERMRASIAAALSRADLVITIGGLGPTMDDLTKEIVCEVLEVPMAIDPVEEFKLKQLIESRNFTVPPVFYKQASVPVAPHGRAVPNPVGTAPGILVEKNGKIAICLPGPPNELIPMVEQTVVPFLSERLGGQRTVIRSQVLRIIGLGESTVEERVQDLMHGESPSVAPYAKLGECHLRITAQAANDTDAERLIAPVESEIRRRLGSAVYGVNDETLEFAAVQLLRAGSLTVATAESCTGGLLAQRITSVAGSSEVFGTGIVSYSNQAKARLLQVAPGLLETKGAVSEEVCRAMADGVRALGRSSYGISITGIAGPGGGFEDKPVGLVFIGLSDGLKTAAIKHMFGGSREDIRSRSSHAALAMLRDQVLNDAPANLPHSRPL